MPRKCRRRPTSWPRTVPAFLQRFCTPWHCRRAACAAGGRLVPWPWTLNVAGESRRYATRKAACTGLLEALRSFPATRIDAGLGQINLGHQKQRYRRPCDLLDPYYNLAQAADILREKHTVNEDWLLAIGRYHRPAGGEPAARYRRSVARHLQRVQGPCASTCLTRKEQHP